MRILRKILTVIFLFVLIGAIGFAIFLTLRSLSRMFAGFDKEVAAAIIVASATILVSVITVVIGKQLEKKREIENQHRIQKIEIYEKFMKKMFEILRLHGSEKAIPVAGKSQKEDDLIKFFEEFSRKLILWGSRGVIKQFIEFRKFGMKSGEPDPRILLQFEKVLMQIRKELGHSNRGLSQYNLLFLFIKDQQNLIRLIESSPKNGYTG